MTISQRIFSILKDKKLKQKDMAAYTGISTSAISAWNKNNTNPAAESISTIADFLDVSIEYLLTGKEKSPSLPDDKVRLLEMYDMLTDMEKGEILGELKQMTKKIRIHTAEIAARSTNNEQTKTVTGDFSDILNAPDSTDDYKT